MYRFFVARFPWLSPTHPLAVREAKRINYDFPKFIRKLSDPWTMLGYAALIHGALFMVSLLGFQHLFPGTPAVMLPFLTPFGTPVAAGLLHSILYWIMLIGICNYTTLLIGHDIETKTWDILRLTPYVSGDIWKVKLLTIARRWSGVLRMLILTRLFALVLIPIGITVQQSSDVSSTLGLNFVAALVFLAQPLVDAFMVGSLSAFSAMTVHNPTWAKLAAYGLVGISYGLLNGIGGAWLMLKSPVGVLGGLFVPLGHWAPLVAASTPGTSAVELAQRIFIVVLVYAVFPVLLGLVVLAIANRTAKRQVG